MRRHIDLGLISALAVGAVIASQVLPDGAIVRVVLAGLLVLIAPGYAIVSAAIEGTRPGQAERLTLSLGLSLAIAACGALLLNITPWRLSTTSWTVFLAGVTLCASIVAVAVRATNAPARGAPLAWQRRAPRPLEVGLLLLATIIGVVALRVSSPPPPQQLNQAYAMLWAVPDRQASSTIHLGVQNMEATREEYVLRVEQYDQTLQEYAIRLEPTQTWQADLQLASGAIDAGGDLQAVLFRADSPFTPFRQTLIRAAG